MSGAHSLAEIPIIGDSYVDMTFGTGVLKVTPAHDVADFVNRTAQQSANNRRYESDATMNSSPERISAA
ncbi:MAG: hypothetical protein ACLUKN_08200 [Bacilli bacterium]